MTKIYFRGNRMQARAVAQRLKEILIGRASDPQQLALGVFNAIGLQALRSIEKDFRVKANGGTGEDGVKWPDLSPAYKAYGRRFGKGEQKKLKTAAGLGKEHRFAPGGNKGLLNKAQLDMWREIFGTRLQRFLLSMPPAAAAARAAQIAWAEVKRVLGAKTKISVYGSRKVQILRDTGILLNSLSPGQIDGGQYTKPTEEGGDQQIFSTISNGVIVGTTVPYAAVHNYGNQAKGIPARPFLPKEFPQVWKDRLEAVAGQAIGIAIRMAYQQGGV